MVERAPTGKNGVTPFRAAPRDLRSRPMTSPVLESVPLGFPWATTDPFLFCVHHLDHYPKGNAEFGPAASLAGRNIGQDFAGKDGWRMYHGETVPGFPAHPHRGFETVTIARRGTIDHSDSLGAAARFSSGDVQWLTAGGGIVHSEMFPLLDPNGPNTVELFQIWLNLPADDKLVPPHFSMLWNKDIPRHTQRDAEGRVSEVTLIAGSAWGQQPPAPPPHSWAARGDTDVAIWTLNLDPGAGLELPPAADSASVRMLYFFEGDSLALDGEVLAEHQGAVIECARPVQLTAGNTRVECLVLQGRPIAEPVVQHGPFVMNTRAQIDQAMSDYRRTRYGGWPWPSDAPVHGAGPARFARHADGSDETNSA
jgi:quercetin 2,3-dioxygenase